MQTKDLRTDRPFIDPYISFWKNSFNFGGRTRRIDFWESTLVNLIPLTLLGFFGYIAEKSNQTNPLATALAAILVLFFFASLIPTISIQVRRLRDSGKSPFWIFLIIINMIPFLGLISSIALFVMYCQPSKTDSNRQTESLERRQDLL